MKPGTLHRVTREARKLADQLGPKLLKKLAQDGVAGDRVAANLFLKYCYPRSRVVDGGLKVELPPIDSASDVPAAIRSVLDTVTAGTLTPAEGSAIVSTLEAYSRSCIMDGHEQRLQALEQRVIGAASDADNVAAYVALNAE
jgi:hypothetical protein